MSGTIISLGMNCEVSSRLQFYYGKISSYPFSWSKINDKNLLVDCLNNNFEDLLTGDISIQEPGMLRFSKYDIGFHCVDRNGVLIDSFKDGLSKEDEIFYINQIKSKQSHLIDKFNALKDEDVSFIFFSLDEMSLEDTTKYAKRLKESLDIYASKGKLYIVGKISKIPNHKIINISNNVYLYKIKSISQNAGDPYKDGDRFGWLKLFKHIKKGKPIRYILKTNRLVHWLTSK